MDWVTEHVGDSRKVTLNADGYILSMAGGVPGSCRFYELVPNATRIVVLPFAGYQRKGESLTCWNNSAETILFVNQALGLVATAAAGQVLKFYLTDNSTASGLWTYTAPAGVAGSPVTFGRVPLDCRIGKDVTDFNLRFYWNQHGYDASQPAALRVWMGTPDYVYVAGASTTTSVGFDSGPWPAGTTLLLVNYGIISGRGGDGGIGGPASGLVLMDALNGRQGGDAMRLRVPTAIVNHGKIQGGGGGGAGGAGQSGFAGGGGGGGGAGYLHSVGGVAGQGGGSTPGISGGAYGGGIGGSGANSGGRGGDPGARGSGSNDSPTFIGGEGGYPGNSIMRLSAVTVTKIRVGTILGAEGTF